MLEIQIPIQDDYNGDLSVAERGKKQKEHFIWIHRNYNLNSVRLLWFVLDSHISYIDIFSNIMDIGTFGFIIWIIIALHLLGVQDT